MHAAPPVLTWHVCLPNNQMTGFRATGLDFDAPSQLLLAAATDVRPTGAGASVVCLHSLRADARGGLLATQGALRPAAPLGGGARPRGAPLLCASLSPLRGPLERCAAVAYGTDVTVTQLPPDTSSEGDPASASASAPVHRAQWRAAEASLSVVAPWPGAPLLLTGAPGAGGATLRGWDLRVKPGGGPPAAQMLVGRGTLLAACPLGETTALTATSAGDVALWDLRAAAAGGKPPPVASAKALPGAPPLALTSAALSPARDAVAVATVAGPLFCASVRAGGAGSAGGGGAVFGGWGVVASPPAAPCAQLAWNGRTRELLAAGADGGLSIYRQW
jgi:hypothetical protein